RARESGVLSQNVAGERVGRSRRWWQELEAGRIDPQVGDLERVAWLLHVDLGWLLDLSAGRMAAEDATDRRRFLALLTTLPIAVDAERLAMALSAPGTI